MSTTARLAKLPVGILDDDQRRLYDSIVGGPRATGPRAFDLVDADGCLEGPFNAMLLSPGMGHALQELGAAVRYRSHLSRRCVEIAILTVAYHRDSDFEIYAHEATGRAVGLSGAELDALCSGRPDDLLDPRERAVAATAAHLLTDRDLDAERYREATDTLGTAALFELSTVVGYYDLLALQLRLFRVERPA